MPYLDLHTHSTIIEEDVISIRNVFPNQAQCTGNTDYPYFSVGLHPWNINPGSMLAEMEEVKTLSNRHLCLAIGETGLDKLTKTHYDLQKRVFEMHLEIACGVSKPVIVHCVRAFQEIVQVQKPFAGKVKLIFHGFNNSRQIASDLLNKHHYLSFGKTLLNPVSNASKVFHEIPNDRFFLETDDSQISISAIYDRAAAIKNLAMDDLKEMILQNFEICFGKKL